MCGSLLTLRRCREIAADVTRPPKKRACWQRELERLAAARAGPGAAAFYETLRQQCRARGLCHDDLDEVIAEMRELRGA